MWRDWDNLWWIACSLAVRVVQCSEDWFSLWLTMQRAIWGFSQSSQKNHGKWQTFMELLYLGMTFENHKNNNHIYIYINCKVVTCFSFCIFFLLIFIFLWWCNLPVIVIFSVVENLPWRMHDYSNIYVYIYLIHVHICLKLIWIFPWLGDFACNLVENLPSRSFPRRRTYRKKKTDYVFNI